MKFNINQYVRVKLTPFGRQILEDQRDKLREKFPSLPKRTITEDEQGWSEWQLWNLMTTFGPYISITAHMPFETDIEISESGKF